MTKLPVIVGFGGINAAGRSSGHHGYSRMILDQLSQAEKTQTLASLASLSGLLRRQDGQWQDQHGNPVEFNNYLKQIGPQLEQSSLIRQLEDNLFDPQNLLFHKKISLQTQGEQALEFHLSKKQLPEQIPAGWQITPGDSDTNVKVCATDNFDVLIQCYRKSAVNSAGQLPSGFDPSTLYASRNHPRGLQLTIFSASDAINSLGIDWQEVCRRVPPDQISVVAGSGLSQLDYNGNGGMLQARLLGKRVSSKQLALGYAEMPADFINAYILGSLGTTGTNVAACATFLYNLRQGIRDIQSGTHRVAVIATSEAPLVPEVFDGFATMGALADDKSLRELDKLSADQAINFRKSSRPFGYNAGFTLAESAQCVVLFDDELALELGANIYGSVNDVFINADGFKKSIASPGLGNYISVAKAAAATQNIIGKKGLRQRSFVQAHGTGTLQNRQTESHILSEVAKTFGISNWPIAAIKSYVGHSLASSAGDQLVASLGVFKRGIIPGILTVDEIASDVYTDNIDFLLQHRDMGKQALDAVLLNSKGFGGNNATASILAPHITQQMLGKRHGAAAFKKYQQANEAVAEKSAAYDESCIAGINTSIYKFDNNVLGSESITMSTDQIKIKGDSPAINVRVRNNYEDMCD